MLLNCGVGEDSWEFLGQQGDQTSPSYRKSVLNIHWKDWCWSWNSHTLATWLKNWLIWKDPDAGKDWRQEEKGMTEDGMVRWHHRHNGHEFEQTLGDRGREAWWAIVHGVGCRVRRYWVPEQQTVTLPLKWTQHMLTHKCANERLFKTYCGPWEGSITKHFTDNTALTRNPGP